MTSATWPECVRRLAAKYLSEPIQLYVICYYRGRRGGRGGRERDDDDMDGFVF
jgi:hypothetical protein